MTPAATMCTCGHDKWSHAIGLDGSVGMCFTETIERWEYCPCDKFTPATDENEKEKEDECLKR